MAAKAAAPASAFDSPEHQKAVEKFKKVKAEKQLADMGAIAILERRSRSATKDVELPGGDVIQIRARLPRTEMQECIALFEQIGAGADGGDSATHTLIGHILYVEDARPVEIAAWLDANPDKFSDIDVAEIVFAFGQMLVEEQERQERIANFRPK